MLEIKTYIAVFEFLCANLGKEIECYETFRDKVKDEKELKDFIKNFRDL